MQVTATPEASAFIESNGGVAYVKARHQRCCHGTMTMLEITTSMPKDPAKYQPTGTSPGGPGPDVRYWRDVPPNTAPGFEHRTQPRTGPSEITIELRGRKRPHLVAFWDGCFYKP